MKRDSTLKEEILNLPNGKILVASDIHFPYEDEKAVSAFIREVAKRKPEVVVLNGDLLDFYKLSKFSKDPSGKNPEEEIEMCKAFLKRIRKEAGEKCKIYYTIGNHSARLRKYILDNAPMVATLMDNVFCLLKLEDYNIVGCASLLVNDTFMFKHGSRLGNKSGLSAIKELEAHYLSGATGHCFSEDVEVLTPQGWRKIIDVNVGDEVGTYNKITGYYEINKVQDKFVYNNYNKLYRIKSMCTDIMTTDKHGFVGYSTNGKYKEFTAEELSKMSAIKIPLACNPKETRGLSISEAELRLLVNICANGTIEDHRFRFHFKKERKIKHLKDILNELNIPYTISKMKTGSTKIGLTVQNSKPFITKFFPDEKKKLPVILRNVNFFQAKIILDEYSLTDGCKNKSAVNAYQLSTNEKEEADLFQEIFVRNGMRTSVILRPSGNYCITVNLKRTITINGKRNASIVPYSGLVSCLTVENGTLIVRSKGKTIITQNTHRLARYSVRKSKRRFLWLETGCLCSLDPEYMIDPDWEQGFGIITFEKGKLKNAQIYPIVNGEVIYD